MRNIIILLLVTIGLAILRMLVSDVTKAASRAMGGSSKKDKAAGGADSKQAPASGGRRLVRDPHTGSYIDEDLAVRATVGETTYYFESKQSRDAYVASRKKGQSG